MLGGHQFSRGYASLSSLFIGMAFAGTPLTMNDMQHAYVFWQPKESGAPVLIDGGVEVGVSSLIIENLKIIFYFNKTKRLFYLENYFFPHQKGYFLKLLDLEG